MKCFFAVLCVALVSAVIAQDPCKGIRAQGFVGDPLNCHGWIRCTREVMDWCGICEWGMVFDAEKIGCNYNTAGCGERPLNPDPIDTQTAGCTAPPPPATVAPASEFVSDLFVPKNL